jgi:hypothetical protein
VQFGPQTSDSGRIDPTTWQHNLWSALDRQQTLAAEFSQHGMEATAGIERQLVDGSPRSSPVDVLLGGTFGNRSVRCVQPASLTIAKFRRRAKASRHDGTVRTL